MKNIIFVLLFLFPVTLHAGQDVEVYALENPDGTINVISYILGSKDSVDDVMKEHGVSNLPRVKVRKEDYGLLSEHIEHLRLEGGRLVVDQTSKQAEQAKIEEAEQAKADLLEKLKITEEEAKLLRKISVQ